MKRPQPAYINASTRALTEAEAETPNEAAASAIMKASVIVPNSVAVQAIAVVMGGARDVLVLSPTRWSGERLADAAVASLKAGGEAVETRHGRGSKSFSVKIGETDTDDGGSLTLANGVNVNYLRGLDFDLVVVVISGSTTRWKRLANDVAIHGLIARRGQLLAVL